MIFPQSYFQEFFSKSAVCKKDIYFFFLSDLHGGTVKKHCINDLVVSSLVLWWWKYQNNEIRNHLYLNSVILKVLLLSLGG